MPIRYNLHLFPNLETFKFSGNLQVELDLKKATNSILCYSAELEIQKAEINEKSAKIEILKDEERVRFCFDDELPVGKCLLDISYTGVHNDKRMGFYRSKSKVRKTGKVFPDWLKYF